MRRISIAALLAAALVFVSGDQSRANPPRPNGFGCGDFCLGLFKGIHQHGPLYNYGPYYGYYPFKPYGPWDAYLRYDPFFYGDPYANWVPPHLRGKGGVEEGGNLYGRNPRLGYLPRFAHASWLHGGWFRGHTWLNGSHALFHKKCSSCGGVAQAAPLAPAGDPLARLAGVGSPDQSAGFYTATPTLDPVLDVTPAGGTK